MVKLDATKRQELKDATKGFWGGVRKALGIGRAGLSGKIDKLEASMSSAYRSAVKAGNTPVTIAGDSSRSIASTQTSGTEVATALQNTMHIAANFMGPGGPGHFARTNRTEGTTIFYSATLSNGSHGQEITTLHEGMHAAVRTGWDSVTQGDHRSIFNDTAQEILDLGQ